jgi:hypothetical protein
VVACGGRGKWARQASPAVPVSPAVPDFTNPSGVPIMPKNICPTCSSPETFQPPAPHGLERRRFPKGRWLCPHETQGWHLRLENAKRELATCSSQTVKDALLCEIALLERQQHPTPPSPVLSLDRGVPSEARRGGCATQTTTPFPPKPSTSRGQHERFPQTRTKL